MKAFILLWICVYIFATVFHSVVWGEGEVELEYKYLGICKAISSKLSDGLMGVFSKSRDGANVK